MSAKIFGVQKGSLGYKYGIRAGQTLLSINHNAIVDVLDYMYHSTSEHLEVAVLDEFGKEQLFKIKNPNYEDLGLNFENYLIDKQKNCHNKCVFCFIDQLPKGMRDTLYYKDDDIRLSFLMGNFVTLTNLKEQDIERIAKLRISPINLSVHTLNEPLRQTMMHHKNAGKINPILEKFSAASIDMRCQIVVCKGLNDKEELKHTLEGLFRFYPNVSSVSVVPVGLTKHREGLFPLAPLNEEDAKDIIAITDEFSKKCYDEVGTNFAFLADELFMKAKMTLPSYEYYEEFPQIENGVGLMASFQNEVEEALSGLKGSTKKYAVSVATGVSASSFIEAQVDKIKEKLQGLDCKIYPVKNEFFGETVNVAGLLTGRDIIHQLKGKPLGEFLLLPNVMLRHQADVFLDDVSIEDMERELNVKIRIVHIDGKEFINALKEG